LAKFLSFLSTIHKKNINKKETSKTHSVTTTQGKANVSNMKFSSGIFLTHLLLVAGSIIVIGTKVEATNDEEKVSIGKLGGSLRGGRNNIAKITVVPDEKQNEQVDGTTVDLTNKDPSPVEPLPGATTKISLPTTNLYHRRGKAALAAVESEESLGDIAITSFPSKNVKSLQRLDTEYTKRHHRMKEQPIGDTNKGGNEVGPNTPSKKTIARSHLANHRQQVLVKYKEGAKASVMNTMHMCDDAAMKRKQDQLPSTYSTSSYPSPMSVMSDMDDMNIVVIEADQGVIDTLMKTRSNEIEAIEIDEMFELMTEKEENEHTGGAQKQQDQKSQDDDEQERKLREHLPWGVSAVQAPSVWNEGFTGQGVKVCVIDSGIDADHTDLNFGNLEGVNVINNAPWYQDACGHGTHVSGTIAAKDDNKGVVGVAPDATIISMRVFTSVNPATGSCNGASTSSILQAANECHNQGADIINLSLGSSLPSNIAAGVYERLVDDYGILVVAAAGNGGNTAFSYPASYDEVMSVGAIREDQQTLASFSQRNNEVDISAPGTNVWSTYTGGSYQRLQGTSMATPHVAGVAALLMQAVPEASASEIRSAMESTAKDLGANGLDNSFGHGMVQAKAALDKLREGNGGGNNGGGEDNGGGEGNSNFLVFTNAYTSECIDVKDAQTYNGNYVQSKSCNGSDEQKWWHEAGTNYLRSALDTNKCLVPSGGNVANGYELVVNDCFENDSRFRFNRYADGSIRPASNTGLCVGPSFSTTVGDQRVIELFICYGMHQVWAWA
jgi:subtilisin family serine protease